MMLMSQNMRIGNNYTRKTGKLTFVFLLLFLFATLATAFHYHHDIDSDHHDCPVCAAGHHFSPASVNSFSLEINQNVLNYDIPKEPLLYNCIRLTLLACRAPPA
jgi:hypothetical protein